MGGKTPEDSEIMVRARYDIVLSTIGTFLHSMLTCLVKRRRKGGGG